MRKALNRLSLAWAFPVLIFGFVLEEAGAQIQNLSHKLEISE